MKKYLRIAQLTFIEKLEYRFEFFADMFQAFVGLAIPFFLWNTIFQVRDELFGYDLSRVLTYYLIANIVTIIQKSDVAWVLSERIKDGTLANILVKPLDFNLHEISGEIAYKLMHITLVVTSLIALGLLWSDKIVLNFDPLCLAQFVVACILAFLISHLIKNIIGMTAFWTKDIGGLNNIVEEATKFLSGSYIPLDFFSVLEKALSFLPFYYTIYFPVKIYMNELTSAEIFKGFVIQLFWIVLLFTIVRIIWLKGLKRFESVGI